MTQKSRCRWCGNQALYQSYHDEEWGKLNKDEQSLFELFLLETQHAGLSWWTVLSKREGYRSAFLEFDPIKMSQMDEADVERLLLDDGIIRNRLKINAMIHNAKTYLRFIKEVDTFQNYFWQKIGGAQIVNHYGENELSPAVTPLSDEIAKEFKKFGFKFFGSTAAYAFLQAAGFIDDHLAECYLSREKE
ncbi:DNA-3-methyladenine glycosylase I [Ignatzschineria rhizosphaerae]|uniref:DNA-3-methyladenine glycosylase I n=1 Tax=Ignatzschineria rhizosphaerae TaxID=2923279 RepID=A0ABY3X587_9GAMM|nr:DNA-3-methyladenine glycosylase I [Ignatzschineria rhizosphaerae]UNM96217.1 DNA-3-methyladenine glycosylase I [Ignatzschineria rhizosphaerae]